MHEPQEINRLTIDLIINVKMKGVCAPARKTMRSDVVRSFPFNNFAGLSRNAFEESALEPLGNFSVFGSFAKQVSFEFLTEDCFHKALPKTCSKVSPGSAPVRNFCSLWAKSALICSSVLGSSSRL